MSATVHSRTTTVAIRLDAVAGQVIVAAYREPFTCATPLAIERLPIPARAATLPGTQLLDYPGSAAAPAAYAQLLNPHALTEAITRVGDAALDAFDA